MKDLSKLAVIAAIGLASMPTAWANDAHHASASTQTTSTEAAMTDGEVKKVDKDAGKVTIKHGPIVNLDMPNMTMVFRVKDPAMLAQVKEGDKIKFAADKLNGAFTVVKLETVN